MRNDQAKQRKVLLLHKRITEETGGVKIRPTNKEVARVGLAIAAGEMKYQELLDWIIENQ